MDAVLEAYAGSPEVLDFVYECAKGSTKGLAFELSRLLRQLGLLGSGGGAIVDPGGFSVALNAIVEKRLNKNGEVTMFRPYASLQMQCPAEFHFALLGALCAAPSAPLSPSAFVVHVEIGCTSCDYRTSHLEPQSVLNLPLRGPRASDGSFRLTDLLSSWAGPTVEEQQCPCCDAQSRNVKQTIVSQPKVLPVALSRWTYAGADGGVVKNETPVSFDPECFNVARLCESALPGKQIVTAAIYHAGATLDGGHCTTATRALSAPGAPPDWHLCNGSSVTSCSSPGAASPVLYMLLVGSLSATAQMQMCAAEVAACSAAAAADAERASEEEARLALEVAVEVAEKARLAEELAAADAEKVQLKEAQAAAALWAQLQKLALLHKQGVRAATAVGKAAKAGRAEKEHERTEARKAAARAALAAAESVREAGRAARKQASATAPAVSAAAKSASTAAAVGAAVALADSARAVAPCSAAACAAAVAMAAVLPAPEPLCSYSAPATAALAGSAQMPTLVVVQDALLQPCPCADSAAATPPWDALPLCEGSGSGSTPPPGPSLLAIVTEGSTSALPQEASLPLGALRHVPLAHLSHCATVARLWPPSGASDEPLRADVSLDVGLCVPPCRSDCIAVQTIVGALCSGALPAPVTFAAGAPAGEPPRPAAPTAKLSSSFAPLVPEAVAALGVEVAASPCLTGETAMAATTSTALPSTETTSDTALCSLTIPPGAGSAWSDTLSANPATCARSDLLPVLSTPAACFPSPVDSHSGRSTLSGPSSSAAAAGVAALSPRAPSVTPSASYAECEWTAATVARLSVLELSGVLDAAGVSRASCVEKIHLVELVTGLLHSGGASLSVLLAHAARTRAAAAATRAAPLPVAAATVTPLDRAVSR